MTRDDQTRGALVTLGAVCSLLVGIAGASVGVVAAESSVTVSQTAQGETTVDPGETVTVEVTVSSVNSGVPQIDLQGVPSGWEVTPLENDSGAYSPTKLEWVWSQNFPLNGDYSHTVTYEVTVPSDASGGNTETIDAVGRSQGPAGPDDDYSDTDSVSITVEESSSPPEPSASLAVTPDSEIGASTSNDQSFQIENTGEQRVNSVTVDLSSATLPDLVFDPSGSAGDIGAEGLTIDDESSDEVGVVSTVDGDVFSQPHNGQDGSDGYDALTIEFDDFDPGETVEFSADIDPTTIKDATVETQEAGTVSGIELTGTTVRINYADSAAQTTRLFGDGSTGGAVAVADAGVSPSSTITPEGVNLNQDVLDARHGAAMVSGADQTIAVEGSSEGTVTLVRIEGELELSSIPEFDDARGYDAEEFEANKAEAVEYHSDTLDKYGEATIPVTLTKSTNAGGLNYFVAAVEGTDGTKTFSNVVVLEYADLEPIGPFDGMPTNSDNDQEFEDVNGDGRVNVGDAQAIFANSDDPVVQSNRDAFDYNGDGRVNVGDAQAIFADGVEV